jgi:hypothetical protein
MWGKHVLLLAVEWLTYISGILPGLLPYVVIFLMSWLFKVWLGRIREEDHAKYQKELATLRANLGTRSTKELLVHELQFQKEFEVYKELWKAALKYAIDLNNFCGVPLVPPQASPEALDQALEASYNCLRDTVYDNRPFYSPGVYKIAINMMDNELFKCLHLHYDKQKLAGLQGAESNEERCQLELQQAEIPGRFKKHLNELCDAIRNRVWTSAYDQPSDEAVGSANE